MLPNREDLSKHYPKPKTYQEMREKRRRYEVDSRPKHTPIKLGVCVTFGVLIIFATYCLIKYIFQVGLSSQSGVVFSVFSAMLVAMVVCVVLGYLYMIVNSIIRRMLTTDRLLRVGLKLTMLASIGGLFLVSQEEIAWISVIFISVVCFIVSAVMMQIANALKGEI